MELSPHPHRRYNPLTGEWVLVSPHRLQRPWQGKTETADSSVRPVYDPRCYLCPGNERAGGARNPAYQETFVFTNDFAALHREIETQQNYDDGLFAFHTEAGTCRVICYTPDHSASFARLDPAVITRVVKVWTEEYEALGALADIRYVQIFENRGAQMGCSNPHPHGQIWANASLPVIPAKEAAAQEQYLQKNGSCLLCDYLAREKSLGERIVLENEHFLVLVPFWAVWPYEVMVLPRQHHPSLSSLSPAESRSLGEILQQLCVRYDNLFQVDFPYSMGIHQQPVDGREHPAWHFHFHFYPPLLRSATVLKYMVGYEMLATPQRDITAEYSARRLRELPGIHYTRTDNP